MCAAALLSCTVLRLLRVLGGQLLLLLCLSGLTCAVPAALPLRLLQQVNIVAVQGRGLHLSIATMRFVLAFQSCRQSRLRLELIDSWDSGGAADCWQAEEQERLCGVWLRRLLLALAAS